jgi:Spy/CpxP family protein refolding chaperone
VLAAIAGLLLGFAGSTLSYRHHWMHVPGRGIVWRMNRELKLTPAQRQRVGEVMDDTRLKMDELRRDFHRQRRQLLGQAFAQIRSSLTPEQQQIFDRRFAFPAEKNEAQSGAKP